MSEMEEKSAKDRKQKEYVPPKAVRLGGARGGAGACAPAGSGDDFCETGNSPSVGCYDSGSSALSCHTGNSAADDCSDGSSG